MISSLTFAFVGLVTNKHDEASLHDESNIPVSGEMPAPI